MEDLAGNTALIRMRKEPISEFELQQGKTI
jgi:hypothetical protein